jgi:hypothetical protein
MKWMNHRYSMKNNKPPENVLGFDWLHSGWQNHLYVYMLLSGIPLFKMMSEDSALLTSQNISVPRQLFGRRVIPSGCPSVHYSIRPDDVPYRPDARQTKHHLSGRRAFPSGPSLFREATVPAYIRPDVSAARSNASQWSISFRFFPSSI